MPIFHTFGWVSSRSCWRSPSASWSEASALSQARARGDGATWETQSQPFPLKIHHGNCGKNHQFLYGSPWIKQRCVLGLGRPVPQAARSMSLPWWKIMWSLGSHPTFHDWTQVFCGVCWRLPLCWTQLWVTFRWRQSKAPGFQHMRRA